MTINSTAIAALSYNESTKVLSVTFQSGQTWVYEGVSRRLRDKVRNAPSVGRAYHQLIRGKFRGYPAK